jgi:DNA-binding MarR family transcriptional regulator
MDLIKQDSATREDLGLLAVMDALADEEQVTQRELSRRTGLNLKKVNYCLHKLLEKGHVKFQRVVNNPDKRAYLYIMTPAGFKAKSHLTYRFLKFTLDFYNQVEVKLRSCLSDMAGAGARRIALCGASEAAKIVLELVDRHGIEVVGVLDSEFVGTRFNGLPVFEREDMHDGEWDGVLITALERLDEVEAELRDWGLPEDRIWRLS